MSPTNNVEFVVEAVANGKSNKQKRRPKSPIRFQIPLNEEQKNS